MDLIRKFQNKRLAKQIKKMNPWHMGIQINDELNTGYVISETGSVLPHQTDQWKANRMIGLLQLRDDFLERIDSIYPEGLSGKRFLDCACNAGGYCFWVSERKIDYAFGFDVRKHWIDQATFVKTHRTIQTTDNIEFAISDLYDLPSRALKPFDITLFKGIFYHLPNPITGLKIAADLTTDVLILNTASKWGSDDGSLALKEEAKNYENYMSGVHGLCWYPSGPKVLIAILKWLGFLEFSIRMNRRSFTNDDQGRIEIFASRKQGRLVYLKGGQLVAERDIL